MRSLSASFLAALALPKVKLAELYTLTLTSGSIYRYTSHGNDIVWDAANNIYTAIPITRGETVFTTNFESSEVGVNLATLALDVYEKLEENVLEGATLQIKLIRWDASYATNEEIVVYSGFIDVDYNRKIINLSVRSIVSMLSVQMPKYVYEEPCNWSLFDGKCGLIQSDYAYNGTATTGTQNTLTDANRGAIYKAAFVSGDSSNPIVRGDTITGGTNGYTAVVVQVVYLTASTGYVYYVEISNVANFESGEVLSSGGNSITLGETPTEDTTFYEMGEIKMTSGDNNGERRQIALDSAGVITFLWPFTSEIQTGDTYTVYPGCNKTASACQDKFGNDNFRGFLYVPGIEEAYS